MRSMLKRSILCAVTSILLISSISFARHNNHWPRIKGKWLRGDFHQHTWYTDGSTSFDFVMSRNDMYGLDWWANSEHGGYRAYDGNKVYWDDYSVYPEGTILGDVKMSGDHQVMYRWQSLRDFVWPDILRNRKIYKRKTILSGVEWNVPGHEHCSVGIIAADATAVSAFEFQFDKSDPDLSRVGEVTPFGTLAKLNGYGVSGSDARHAHAVEAVKWTKAQKDAGLIDDAWIIFAHIERKGAYDPSRDRGYNVEHFRDFNNAAPEICYGFEGVPGHQPSKKGRGGFGTGAFGGTYGGAGYYTAIVGGLWDALLGEGRRWFNFASSDYHRHWTKGGSDYYPGEYQKTWSYVQDLNRNKKTDPCEIAASLRSGNSYNVMGDLVNKLSFKASIMRRSRTVKSAEMGGELVSYGPINTLRIKIHFDSPKYNNNGDIPKVDHFDLIAGDITGKIDPSSPDYTNATNLGTQVIATFTSDDWKVLRDGSKLITYTMEDVSKSMYFRIRGTNMAPGTEGETDVNGNPLADTEAPVIEGESDGERANRQAWADLWVYGNPIFVYVK